MRPIVVGALLVLVLAGCGAAATAPPPTPRAVAAAPPRNPLAERQAGRLLAAISLLGTADTQLRQAYNLQNIQLPDSARATFADAAASVAQAGFILTQARGSSLFGGVLRLLEGSLGGFYSAAAEGPRHARQSKRDTSGAEVSLSVARNRLLAAPEAGSSLAAEVQQQSLLHSLKAVPPPAPTTTPVPKVTVVSSPRQLVQDVSPTATLTATHRTANPVARRPVRAGRAHGHVSSAHQSGAAATPTKITPAQPVRVGTPSPTPAPSPTPTPMPFTPAMAQQFVASLLPINAVARGTRALLGIERCEAYVRAVEEGGDPLGSAKIVRCIDGAVSRTVELRASITSLREIDMAVPVPRFAVALADLAQARAAVGIADISGAYMRLVAAQVAVDRLLSRLIGR